MILDKEGKLLLDETYEVLNPAVLIFDVDIVLISLAGADTFGPPCYTTRTSFGNWENTVPGRAKEDRVEVLQNGNKCEIRYAQRIISSIIQTPSKFFRFPIEKRGHITVGKIADSAFRRDPQENICLRTEHLFGTESDIVADHDTNAGNQDRRCFHVESIFEILTSIFVFLIRRYNQRNRRQKNHMVRVRYPPFYCSMAGGIRCQSVNHRIFR